LSESHADSMPSILYLTYPFGAIYIFAIALGLGAFLTKRFGFGWRLYWIGAATFILSQIGHIPFNAGLTALFQNGVLPSPPASAPWHLVFNAVILGLSAGLFEEIARYAAYRWWAKDARSWGKGLLLGAGHGGIEALIVGMLLLVTFVVMVTLRDADLSRMVGAEQLALAQEQVRAYWSAAWYDSLLGAVERTFTLPAHVAFSILVLQVFLRRQIRWLLYAIGWHALLNAITLFIAGTWDVYLAELVLGLLAIASVMIVFSLRQPEAEEKHVDERATMAMGASQLPDLEESTERLDKTKYQD
jgi:uncharacterized membrane protein YhfC